MGGWKTWAGVGGLMVAATCNAFGMHEIANGIYGLSVPMVIVGIGSKLDKVLRAVGAAANSAADQLEKARAAAPPPQA